MTKEEIWADTENLFGTDVQPDWVQEILDKEHKEAVPDWNGEEYGLRQKKMADLVARQRAAALEP